MERPKTGPPIGIRTPEELVIDVDAAAQRAGQSRSEWVLDTIERRLATEWASRADWYMLRGIDPCSPRLHGSTVQPGVEQCSTAALVTK
jgi:hypothetical protein